MPVIELKTLMDAPRERVFDLARSIEAHQVTSAGTRAEAVAGVTSGLLGLDDTVTWEAHHLGLRRRLTVRLTQLDRPRHFQDVMVRGAFGHMTHDHHFEEQDGQTLMTDRFDFCAPHGILGRILDRLYLEGYMRRFMQQGNRILKRIAESDEWQRYLNPDSNRDTSRIFHSHRD